MPNRPRIPRKSKADPSQAPAANTGQKLLEAAKKEFNERGFFGTDTNKIAHRAGFAPQTFYRWFADKLEAFLFVYRAWQEEEEKVIGGLIAKGAPAAVLADAIIAHHRDTRFFRRSLRQLAVEDPAVRKARAESRLRQLENIKSWIGDEACPKSKIAPLLLQIERMCDAVAEDEFSDLGVDEQAARAAIVDLLIRIRR